MLKNKNHNLFDTIGFIFLGVVIFCVGAVIKFFSGISSKSKSSSTMK